MFEAKAISVDDKATLYRELAQQLGGLLHGERDAIANANRLDVELYDRMVERLLAS